MSKKILTLEEQKHLYLSIAEIFDDASEQDIASIIARLGLDSVIDEEGSLVPIYSLITATNKPTLVTADYDIELEGSAYNYFAEITDDVVSWEWTRDSGDPIEDAIWNEGRTQRVLNLTRADFPSNFEERDTTFKLKATLSDGSTITEETKFSRVQTFNKVQIETSSGLFIEETPDSIYAEAVTDFQVKSYKWYINDYLSGTGQSYSIDNESVPPGDSIILKVVAEDMKGGLHSDVMSIPRLESGKPGPPGVEGPPGDDGRSSYTWVKYADGLVGENMSNFPVREDGTAREYIGLALDKDTSEESEDPTDYTWTRYIGEDGAPGENGYMWVKYSRWSDGRDTDGTPDMYDTPFIIEPGEDREDMIFLGIAYNKDERQAADQNTPEGAPEQYLWSRIKGEDGLPGLDGENGLSAYEIWIEEGNTGTEQEFINSLKGADGERGEDGDTPLINPDGNWEIGGDDTGVPAEGQAGEPGLTCRRYELDIEEDSEIKYTPCDNCDNQETTEMFLKPIPCGEQGNFQSGRVGYPIIQPLNLGTSTGEVLVEVDAVSVPDRFILYREGVHVLDSGYRGRSTYGIGGTARATFINSLNGKVDPITGNTYPLSIGTPGIESDGYPEVKDNGVLIYNKTGAGSDYEMRVYAPAQGTAWNFTVGCPEGSTAAKSTLTLYSTTEPEFITGSGSVMCIGLASGRVGEVGPPGESPYQIWLSLGNTGTRQDYIDSLKGEQGDSAYEVWRQQPGNNSKTEADFLVWLRAASGDKYFEFVVDNETTARDIPHNLNKYPSVSAFDTAGTRLEIRVVYTSKNDVTVMSDESLKGVTVVFN